MTPRTIFFILLVISSAFGGENEGLGEVPSGPSESECRPYIEKALQGAGTHDEDLGQTLIEDVGDQPVLPDLSIELEEPADAANSLESVEAAGTESIEDTTENSENVASQEENVQTESNESTIEGGEVTGESNQDNTEEDTTASAQDTISEEAPDVDESSENVIVETTEESSENEPSKENTEESQTENAEETVETVETVEESRESDNLETVETVSAEDAQIEAKEETENQAQPSEEETTSGESDEMEKQNVGAESLEDEGQSQENAASEDIQVKSEEDNAASAESEVTANESVNVDESKGSEENTATEEQTKEVEDTSATEEVTSAENEPATEENQSPENNKSTEEAANTEELSQEQEVASAVSEEEKASTEEIQSEEEKPTELSLDDSAKAEVDSKLVPEIEESINEQEASTTAQEAETEAKEDQVEPEGEKPTEAESPEEELIMEIEIPKNLRSRNHMGEILQLDVDTAESEKVLGKIADGTLRELKKLYDAAIKPLEILYKYRDLSNRHFGDPEIFSKPLILFMGPWSGGKSTIINYLLENEYKRTALRTGAEPSPAYFNIVMWGEQEEVLDGTQLAADWTFSGLQKFGQGLLDRLRGLKLNHPLLEKVNIVEIPGILEIRKQVERLFPFNDACQWFIDRADIIFLVYDPSKLDVGPESEAILDQLKGREMQTRIILNKADQVRPEELMRVQGTLIWNISPLMSSTEPPVMYSTSLWSLPYEVGAPTRLLYAQERAFLRDLREAVTKRVENKIASARRFAVRVRNHAKMVDCYLTTYYNHKSFFGNKKKVSDDIIEHPQNYHIYEGLSTLTNISRYDLPDPDVYRDFFRLNPVYEFQQLASTCTYFRGCPINRLDIAIAYDLPELIGKYKKSVEELSHSKK